MPRSSKRPDPGRSIVEASPPRSPPCPRGRRPAPGDRRRGRPPPPRRSGEHRFHRTIPAVSHPAFQPAQLRVMLHPGPESDALHAAVDKDMHRAILLHDTLGTMTPPGTMRSEPYTPLEGGRSGCPRAAGRRLPAAQRLDWAKVLSGSRSAGRPAVPEGIRREGLRGRRRRCLPHSPVGSPAPPAAADIDHRPTGPPIGDDRPNYLRVEARSEALVVVERRHIGQRQVPEKSPDQPPGLAHHGGIAVSGDTRCPISRAGPSARERGHRTLMAAKSILEP